LVLFFLLFFNVIIYIYIYIYIYIILILKKTFLSFFLSFYFSLVLLFLCFVSFFCLLIFFFHKGPWPSTSLLLHTLLQQLLKVKPLFQ
jgi:hypothetical protein